MVGNTSSLTLFGCVNQRISGKSRRFGCGVVLWVAWGCNVLKVTFTLRLNVIWCIVNYALLWFASIDWYSFSTRCYCNGWIIVISCLIHQLVSLLVENWCIYAAKMLGVFTKAVVATRRFENAACQRRLSYIRLMEVRFSSMCCKKSRYWHTVHTLFILFNSLLELSLGKGRFVGVDSDVGHVGNQGVLFDYGTDGISEILYLFLFGCGNESAHPCLAL